MVTSTLKRAASLPVVLAGAAASTAITFAVVAAAFPRDSYVYVLFFERSWIQHASTFAFWVTIITLATKHLAFRQERAAYTQATAILAQPEFQGTLIWSDANRVRDTFGSVRYALYQTSITFVRILNALDRLRKTQTTTALADYFRTRSDFDAGDLENGYAGIRYFIWLIPTLGFIGTVMGIGIGISGFAGTIAHAKDFEDIRKFLPEVTFALGTAFDTTLLALLLSALAVFYMSFLLKRQEHLLGEIDTLCFDQVCALFQEHSTASDEIVRAIEDTVQQIIDRMNGNRAKIESVIRHELPTVLRDELLGRPQAGVPDVPSALAILREQASELRELARAVRESTERTRP